MNEDIHVTAQPRPNTGYSEIPDWVTEASSHAYKLYGVLRGYADNRTRKAWPSLATLAARMGFGKPDTVTPYVKELEAMGAITVTRSRAENGTKNVNIYHVKWDRPQGTPEPGGSTPDAGGRGTPVERGTVPPPSGVELHPLNYTQSELLPYGEAAGAAPAPAPSDQPLHGANEIVRLWLEHCEERPPSRIVGQVSKTIKGLLDEGIRYDRVLAGVQLWHESERSTSPSVIPGFVHDAMKAFSPPSPMNAVAIPERQAPPRVNAKDAKINGLMALAAEAREQERREAPALTSTDSYIYEDLTGES